MARNAPGLRSNGATRLFTGLLALALVLCTGCGNKELWPLQEGNEWVYHERIKQSATPTGEVRYSMDSVEQDGDNATSLIRAFRETSADPFQEIELTRTPHGLYESARAVIFHNGNPGVQKTTFSPSGTKPPYLFLHKANVGDTWDFAFQANNPTLGTSLDFTGRGEAEAVQSVSPTAGRFKALRVAWRAEQDRGTGFENRIYWFKSGVGPVKIEIQTPNTHTVLMLKRARIGKKKIGKW